MTTYFTGLRGLKLSKSQTNYWVEFRQKFTSNKWLMERGGLPGGKTRIRRPPARHHARLDRRRTTVLVIGRITPHGFEFTLRPRQRRHCPESLDVMVNSARLWKSIAHRGRDASATNAATAWLNFHPRTRAMPTATRLAYYWISVTEILARTVRPNERLEFTVIHRAVGQ